MQSSTPSLNKAKKRIINLLGIAVILGFLVIILGSFTRLSDAGLGCPDWPGCYGHLLWPDSPDEIAQANEAWPHAQVETHKTWPEMIHRYFASSLGLLSIIILFFAIKDRRQLKRSLFFPVLILCVVILQGIFGMWTVTLKLWPQVVTGHLLGGFTTLSLFWLFLQTLTFEPLKLDTTQSAKIKKLLPWLALSLLVVFMQIAIGGWTTSNYAAVACPDLPTCQNSWWPDMDFVHGFNIFQEIGPNYLGGHLDNAGRMAIHMTHRIGAVVTLVVLFFTALACLRTGVQALRPKVFALLGVLFLQLLLGVSNIIFNFPLSVAVAHNAFGALLLLKTISLLYAAYQYSRHV